MHDAGVAMSILTVRGVMLATIISRAPEILNTPYRDGSTFKASDDFVRRWMRCQLNWSERKATRAAQKIPEDWEEKCERSFLRKAYSIKEYDIPSALYVNSDQTQVVYAPGNKMTYAPIGAKQVSLVGGDEKHAFTVMVSVANDGTLLPFQAIYTGLSAVSCPSKTAAYYDEVMNAGMLLEHSGMGTYWLNVATMHSFVNSILGPYFASKRAILGLPPTQKALWQIDVWSVHRSKEFRGWMSQNHDNIILDYVPGGCTGLHQPCDVGIQRPFKHSVKQSYHESIVQEMLARIEKNEPVLAVDKRIKIVWDQSVTWLWNTYNVVNNKALVKKVWSIDLLRVSGINNQSKPASHLRCVVYVGGTYPMKVLPPSMPERNLET
jgi:DDE superfamily endonuclease